MEFLIIFYIIMAMLFFGILVYAYVNKIAKVEEHENVLYLLMLVTSMVWPLLVLVFSIKRLKGVKK